MTVITITIVVVVAIIFIITVTIRFCKSNNTIINIIIIMHPTDSTHPRGPTLGYVC